MLTRTRSSSPMKNQRIATAEGVAGSKMGETVEECMAGGEEEEEELTDDEDYCEKIDVAVEWENEMWDWYSGSGGWLLKERRKR